MRGALNFCVFASRPQFDFRSAGILPAPFFFHQTSLLRTNAVGVPQVSPTRKRREPLPRFVPLPFAPVHPRKPLVRRCALTRSKLSSELSVWYYPSRRHVNCPQLYRTYRASPATLSVPKNSTMNNRENPFKIGDRVIFSPDKHTIGWSWSSCDRLRIHPGDIGVVTQTTEGAYLYLDDRRGGFHWEYFKKVT
jgi:hypothetical protein